MLGKRKIKRSNVFRQKYEKAEKYKKPKKGRKYKNHEQFSFYCSKFDENCYQN
jgi:hypothetical protein